jgi:hypothetical protein
MFCRLLMLRTGEVAVRVVFGSARVRSCWTSLARTGVSRAPPMGEAKVFVGKRSHASTAVDTPPTSCAARTRCDINLAHSEAWFLLIMEKLALVDDDASILCRNSLSISSQRGNRHLWSGALLSALNAMGLTSGLEHAAILTISSTACCRGLSTESTQT